MTNIEKVNKALANADESKIKEVLDFLGYKENSKFIPKQNEQYWTITNTGEIDGFYWWGDSYDNRQLLIDNVYRTEEEAEQALDFQTRKGKLIKEIEDSSDVIDWNDIDQRKYFFYFDYNHNSLDIEYYNYIQEQGTTYTTNPQFLEELIKERSGEVKELLFGIKL